MAMDFLAGPISLALPGGFSYICHCEQFNIQRGRQEKFFLLLAKSAVLTETLSYESGQHFCKFTAA